MHFPISIINRITFLLGLGLICISPAAAQLAPMPAGPQQKGLPSELKDIGIDQRLNEQVPLDLTFRDEQGRPVQLKQYFKDKPVVLSLVYYSCPMLCPQTLDGLRRSLDLLTFDVGREYEVLTVSFDPADKPETAAGEKKTLVDAYNRPGAAEGWHFLTGEEPSIEKLTSAVGFKYRYDPKTMMYVHATGIMILTPEGKISRYFYGLEFKPTDLRLGLVEASEHKVGSPVDQVLLYCFHYDTSRGKYTLLTMNLVRIGGLLILAFIGVLLLGVRMINKKRARFLRETEFGTDEPRPFRPAD
ncbi:MAG TPA: SCO family protein [Blastocatellia bacterium]|nr:SCO family protein [Blastocatellia bacterium]